MRKRSRNVWLPLVGAVSVSVGLLGSMGCTSSQPQAHAVEEDESSAPAVQGTTEGSPRQVQLIDEETAPVDEVSAERTPRPAQTGSGGGSPDEVTRDLDDLSERQRQQVTELEAASAWAISRANQLIRSSQFARAQNLLRDMQAQLTGRTFEGELDHNYQEIQRLLNEVESYLGTPRSERVHDASRVQQAIEESRATAAESYEKGKRLLAEDRYRDAREQFERVLNIVRFAPSSDELEEQFGEEVRTLINQTRRLERQQQSDEVQRLRELAQEAALQEQLEQERRERENIDALWGDALFNMQLRRYETAERLAEMIIAQDPSFREAREMLNDIKSLRLRSLRERNAERQIEMYRRLWAEWYESKIPLAGGTVEYPGGAEWRRIANREQVQWRDSVEPPEVRRIEEVLSTGRIAQVRWDNVRLSEALSELFSDAGIPFTINPDYLRDVEDFYVGGMRGQRDLPYRDALNQLLSEPRDPLQYVIRDGGYVYITAQDDPDVDARMVVRLHDVRDLAMPVNHFPAGRIRLPTSDGRGDGLIMPPDMDVQGIQPEELDWLIEEQFEPGTFDPPAAIVEVAGQLFVRAPNDIQEEVREFLEELRDAYGLVVTIEARFITVDDLYLSDFGIDWRGLGGQSPGNTAILNDVTVGAPDFAGGTVDNASNSAPPGQVVAGLFFNEGTPGTTSDIRGRFENVFDRTLGNLLEQTGGLGVQYTIFMDDDKQFQLVLHALQKSRNATILNAPRLSAFNAQQANITVMNEVSYIADYNAGAGGVVADPEIEQIADGMILDIRPTVSNDRRFITIELQPSLAELVRPIPEFTTTLGGGAPVTIQLPELILQSLQTTVMCPDGGVVVVGGMKMIRDIDRESTTPLLGDIPIIGTLFRRKGRSLENRSMIVIVKAMITDLREEERRRQQH